MKINWYRMTYCAIFFLIGVSLLLFDDTARSFFNTFTVSDLITVSLLILSAFSFSIFLYLNFSIHDYLYMIGLGNPISKKDISKEYRNDMNYKMDIQLSKIRRCNGTDKISTTFYTKSFAISRKIAIYASIILFCLSFISSIFISHSFFIAMLLMLSTYPIFGCLIVSFIQCSGSRLSHKAYALDLNITKNILERKANSVDKYIIVNNIKLSQFYYSLISLLTKESKEIESILKKRDFSLYRIPYGKYEDFVFNEFKDEIKDFTKCFVGYVFYKDRNMAKFIYDTERKSSNGFFI